MKYIITFVCLFTFLKFATAQITVTNTSFPLLGDSLLFFTDDKPQTFDMSSVGGNQTWDFSSLKKINPSTRLMKDAKICDIDKKFTDAEFCQEESNFNIFYNVKSSAFEVIGIQGNLFGGNQFNIPNSSRYTPAQIIRRSPMKFFDVNNTSFNQRFAFSTAALPDSLLGQAAGLLDSIRVSLASTRLDVVDAWGTCKIPAGVYEVLREKRTQVTETKLEAHSFLGWIDLSTILGGQGGGAGGLGDLIGKDTTISFHFVNNKSKEDIAVLSFNTKMEPTDAVFKRLYDPTASIDLTEANSKIFVSPNPAKDQTTLHLNNFKTGKYYVALTSINNHSFERKVDIEVISNNQKIQLDISKFSNEIVIINIFDRNGKSFGIAKIAVL